MINKKFILLLFFFFNPLHVFSSNRSLIDKFLVIGAVGLVAGNIASILTTPTFSHAYKEKDKLLGQHSTAWHYCSLFGGGIIGSCLMYKYGSKINNLIFSPQLIKTVKIGLFPLTVFSLINYERICGIKTLECTLPNGGDVEGYFGEKLKDIADLVIEDIDGEGKAKDFLKAKINRNGRLQIVAQDNIQEIINNTLSQKKLTFEALDLICCELKIKIYKNWFERIFDKIKYLIRDRTDVDVAEAYEGINLFHTVFKGRTIKDVYEDIKAQKSCISATFSVCIDRILTNASKNVQGENYQKSEVEKKDKPMKIDTFWVKMIYSAVEYLNRKIYIVDQKNWNHAWKNFLFSGVTMAAAMSLLRTHKITFKR